MQVDDRVTLDDYRVAAWVEILDADMTLDFAIGAVRNHYASETTVLMPAHVNRAWRQVRLREKEKSRTKAITGVQKQALSAESAAQLDYLKRRFLSIANSANPDKAEEKTDRSRPENSTLNSTTGF
jgi:hypothetical protein